MLCTIQRSRSDLDAVPSCFYGDDVEVCRNMVSRLSFCPEAIEERYSDSMHSRPDAMRSITGMHGPSMPGVYNVEKL